MNRKIFFLSMARFLQSMAASSFIPILPIYIEHLKSPFSSQWSITVKAGFLVSIFGFTMTLIQSPVAYLSDWLRRRKIFVVVAVFLFGLLSFALGEVENYYSLLVVRALQGLCVGVTIPILLAMLASFSSYETRGQAMGIYSTFHLVGFVVGPLVGGMVADFYGFQTAFYTGGALAILCLIFVFFLVPETVEKVRRTSRTKEKLPRDHYILAFILFSMMVGIVLIIPLFPLYKKKFHSTNGELSWIFSALIVTRILTQIPVGSLADSHSKKHLIFLGLLLFIPLTLLLGYATTANQMILLRLGQGGATTLIMTPAMALAANLATPELRGRAMGVIGMGFTSGVCLGPLMAGGFAEFNPALPFWIAGAICLVALGIGWAFLGVEKRVLLS